MASAGIWEDGISKDGLRTLNIVINLESRCHLVDLKSSKVVSNTVDGSDTSHMHDVLKTKCRMSSRQI